MRLDPLPPGVLAAHIPGLVCDEDCFARGGFKWVYRARVESSLEALKVLLLGSIDEGAAEAEPRDGFLRENVARIRREIEALRKCTIPEIVKLGAVQPTEFAIQGEYYLAYSEEFVVGTDLWQQIKCGGERPGLQELIGLFACLLRCVEELWKHGYVHRDIKPSNVMRTGIPERPFVLLDLGIAYAVHDTGLTYRPQERMPMATYRYLAPEMMRPDFRSRIDYRTDLYTIGMTVYEYAAGRHPLARDADDLMQTISRALRQPPVPLAQYRPDLPRGFYDLVDGMLKKNPALRPANLKTLFRKLEDMR
jgi:serine/threonine-protein kinase